MLTVDRGCHRSIGCAMGRLSPKHLRVQPAKPGRLSYALDGDGLGSKTRLDPVCRRTGPDGIGRGQDLTTQPVVDLIESPGHRGSVLGPLVVADDDAARVAQDVWENHDSVAAKD